MLIAIEGVDGAGKHTLADGLAAAFGAAGKSVATLAFPRYGVSVTADVAAEALRGQHGDLADSVYAMAMLFALDRAGAKDQIAEVRRGHDVLILDRYVASSAAYSAARLHQDAAGEVVDWVRQLEFERLGLPAPDWQVLLDVPAELAAQRARHREDHDTTRARDTYERDAGLQRRTGQVYRGLAQAGFGGRWQVVGPAVMRFGWTSIIRALRATSAKAKISAASHSRRQSAHRKEKKKAGHEKPSLTRTRSRSGSRPAVAAGALGRHPLEAAADPKE